MKKGKKIFGRGANQCKRCSRKSGLVRKYGIYLCSSASRDAPEMGFESIRSGCIVIGSTGRCPIR